MTIRASVRRARSEQVLAFGGVSVVTGEALEFSAGRQLYLLYRRPLRFHAVRMMMVFLLGDILVTLDTKVD